MLSTCVLRCASFARNKYAQQLRRATGKKEEQLVKALLRDPINKLHLLGYVTRPVLCIRMQGLTLTCANKLLVLVFASCSGFSFLLCITNKLVSLKR